MSRHKLGGIASNENGAGDRRQGATNKQVNSEEEGTVPLFLIKKEAQNGTKVRGQQTVHHIKA